TSAHIANKYTGRTDLTGAETALAPRGRDEPQPDEHAHQDGGDRGEAEAGSDRAPARTVVEARALEGAADEQRRAGEGRQHVGRELRGEEFEEGDGGQRPQPQVELERIARER